MRYLKIFSLHNLLTYEWINKRQKKRQQWRIRKQKIKFSLSWGPYRKPRCMWDMFFFFILCVRKCLELDQLLVILCRWLTVISSQLSLSFKFVSFLTVRLAHYIVWRATVCRTDLLNMSYHTFWRDNRRLV